MKPSTFLLLPLVSLVLMLAACEKRVEVDLSAVPVDLVEQGVSLIPTYCNTCHGVGEKEIDEMLAPPLWSVRAHYLSKYPEPEAFVERMAAFIVQPQMEERLLPLAVQRYGLKAPVSLSEEDIRAVVWAIYAGRVERPTWSREYQKRHGSCEAVW